MQLVGGYLKREGKYVKGRYFYISPGEGEGSCAFAGTGEM